MRERTGERGLAIVSGDAPRAGCKVGPGNECDLAFWWPTLATGRSFGRAETVPLTFGLSTLSSSFGASVIRKGGEIGGGELLSSSASESAIVVTGIMRFAAVIGDAEALLCAG